MTVIKRFFSGLRLIDYRLRSWAIRTYLHLAYPGLRCHPSVRFGRGVTVRAFDGARLEIGEGTVVLDYAQVQADAGGTLRIGKSCLVGRGSVIVCTESIEIGDGTLIAEHVTVRDQDHRHEGEGRLEGKGRNSAPIRIGHDVWLGAKSTVTRGVEIAPHAVIGANAVVTRSLLERDVYVGAPARPIRKASA